MKKISRAEEFFESNYFQMDKHVVRLHINYIACSQSIQRKQ